MAGALSDSEYERLWQEATTRQQLGDDSLMRQLVGMPAQAAAVAYDPWGYGNGNESSGGSKYPSGLYQSGVTIWNSGSNTINNDLTAAYRVDNPHATGYVSDSSLRRDIT